MATGFKSGGRKKGTPNRRTIAQQAMENGLKEKLEEALGPNAFDGDAHAFLTWCYKNDSVPLNFRIESAGKAVAYEKPKLQTHTVEGGDKPVKMVIEWSSE